MQAKGETFMLNQFQAYLVQRGYREFSINGNPSTAIDYAWRVAKVCEKENYTAKQLADNINTILEQYGPKGEKWTTGRRSHHSYFQALRHFRKFILVQRFGGANA